MNFQSKRKKTTKYSKKKPIDVSEIAYFLGEISGPLKKARGTDLLFDPWEIAELGHLEVRNTAVLAWILNPKGSHGLGALGLDVLLNLIFDSSKISEIGNLSHALVKTEAYPDSQNNDRVDIEISTPRLYLIIEVKINAKEQENQIGRYCNQAKIRAGDRPWKVIFITPSGRNPSTSEKTPEGEEDENVVPISWRKLCSRLEVSLKGSSFKKSATKHAVLMFTKRCRKF